MNRLYDPDIQFITMVSQDCYLAGSYSTITTLILLVFYLFLLKIKFLEKKICLLKTETQSRRLEVESSNYCEDEKLLFIDEDWKSNDEHELEKNYTKEVFWSIIAWMISIVIMWSVIFIEVAYFS